MIDASIHLPEWSVLSSKSHQGDLLFGRTVLVHVQSYTVMEVIPFEYLPELPISGPSIGVEYIDQNDESQKVLFLIHFTLSNDFEGIFNNAADWYGNYMEWMDKNKQEEIKMKNN